MSEQLPPELLARCQAIEAEDNQAVPLTSADYLLFAVVTVLIPALIIVLGVLL